MEIVKQATPAHSFRHPGGVVGWGRGQLLEGREQDQEVQRPGASASWCRSDSSTPAPSRFSTHHPTHCPLYALLVQYNW